ncbi:MAG TPA: zinc ribbon domain-containing protein [Phycisphaerales bacterium]|nr:zinc ribbon domain-containing protein [Phycisphaerales bacterium]
MDAVADINERFCLNCGHSLKGLSSTKCPECGREFDPHDARTTDGRRRWLRDRTLARAAQLVVWEFGVLAVVFFVLTLIGVDPIWVYIVTATSSIVWVPSLLYMVGVIFMPKVPLDWRVRMCGLVLPILIFSMVWTYWPFRITFQFHRSRLNAIAQQVEAGQSLKMPLHVGMFEIRSATQSSLQPGVSRLDVRGRWVSGTTLFHSPGNVNSWRYNKNWEIDLGGGWYYGYDD